MGEGNFILTSPTEDVYSGLSIYEHTCLFKVKVLSIIKKVVNPNS